MIASLRFFVPFVALLVCCSASSGLQAAPAFIIVDAQSGQVLRERDSRQKRQIGSLTKVATAMVVLDWVEKRSGDPGQIATVPPEALAGTGDNLVGLQPGDTITVRDLLYAALVQSDNVAAYTLAAHVGQAIQGLVPTGGSPVGTFVSQMNALARNLKMERTLFVNPHGQDANVKPMPYSTAADMARLTRYAISKAAFRFYVSQKERQISWNRGGKTQSYMLRNTNEMLGTNGVDGVKTGRTARAGDCLILSAGRESEVIKHSETSATVIPRHLILVLLGSANRFSEAAELLNAGWQSYDQWAATGRTVDRKKTL